MDDLRFLSRKWREGRVEPVLKAFLEEAEALLVERRSNLGLRVVAEPVLVMVQRL